MNTQDILSEAARLKDAGDEVGARELLKIGAERGNVRAAINFAKLIPNDQINNAISVLNAVSGATPEEEVSISRLLLFYGERTKRVERNLYPFHITSLDELGFKYAVDEHQRYRRAALAYPKASQDIGFVAFHDHHRDSSFYAQFKGHIMGTVDFDLPAENGGEPGTDKHAAIWMGCDKLYHAFANPFIKSIKSHGPLDVILHTFEDHKAKHLYYHSERFVKLAEWMEQNDRPVWLMDVDAIANRNPAELFTLLDGYDVAFRGRPGRLEPWNQINASIVGFNNTPAGKSYLKTIAAFIKRAYERRNISWGVDQVAMLCCLEACKPKVRLLGPSVADYDYTPEGVIWMNSGKNKWEHLKPGAVDPARQKFLDAFQKWV